MDQSLLIELSILFDFFFMNFSSEMLFIDVLIFKFLAQLRFPANFSILCLYLTLCYWQRNKIRICQQETTNNSKNFPIYSKLIYLYCQKHFNSNILLLY